MTKNCFPSSNNLNKFMHKHLNKQRQQKVKRGKWSILLISLETKSIHSWTKTIDFKGSNKEAEVGKVDNIKAKPVVQSF